MTSKMAQDGPRWLKMAPKMPQETPRPLQDGSKRPPSLPKRPPRGKHLLKTQRKSMMFAFSAFRFRWPSEASRWLQDGPRWPQEGPKRAPRRPQECPSGPRLASTLSAWVKRYVRKCVRTVRYVQYVVMAGSVGQRIRYVPC